MSAASRLRSCSASIVLLGAGLFGCEDSVDGLQDGLRDAGVSRDAASHDGGGVDVGSADAGGTDTGAPDAGSSDAAPPDVGLMAPSDYTWRLRLLPVEGYPRALDLNEGGDVLAEVRPLEPGERAAPHVWHEDVWIRLEALAASPLVLAYRFNDRRQVIGVASRSTGPSDLPVPFRYDLDGHEVTWIPPEAGQSPQDIANDGTVLLTTPVEDTARPVLWRGPDAPVRPLSTAGMTRGAAMAISNGGAVIGNALRPNTPYAVVWPTPEAAVTLPADGASGTVSAISPNGRRIVGEISPTGMPSTPVHWVDGVRTAPSPPRPLDFVADINDSGWILLGRDGLAYEGIRYPLGDLVDLSPYDDVTPVAVNNAGIVLVTVFAGGGTQVGLLAPDLGP